MKQFKDVSDQKVAKFLIADLLIKLPNKLRHLSCLEISKIGLVYLLSYLEDRHSYCKSVPGNG